MIKTYTEHRTIYRETLPPEGYSLVWESYPDINGENFAKSETAELRRVLSSANIVSVSCPIRRENASPMGSGPGGRIRFGDSMMPSTHRIFVPTDSLVAAKAAIDEHKAAIKLWLDKKDPMPTACYN